MQKAAPRMHIATKITLDQSTYPTGAASAANEKLDTAHNIKETNTEVLNLLIAHSLKVFIYEFRALF
jgi:uncharacterized protein HemY